MISMIDVSKQAGCDVVSVRRWAKSNGIQTTTIPAKNNKLATAITDEDAHVFLGYWKSKMLLPSTLLTIPQVAKSNHVDRKTVRLWAERQGITLTKISQTNSPDVHVLTKEQAKQFAEWYHNSDTVAVVSLLEQYNTDWRVIKRWAKKNGKKFYQVRSELGGRGKYSLLKSDVVELERHLIQMKDDGFFYVIQPVPELNPNRLKLGFSKKTDRRLREHKCVCPNAILVKRWKCRKTDEANIRNYATQQGCQQLFTNINNKRCATEVFDCEDMQLVLSRIDQFFVTQQE
jgi:hypothetical protein